MPAALLVSTLHSALRLLLDRVEPGPELLERLSRHILESSAPNRFITLMMAKVVPAGDRLYYVNAGHNPSLLLRADGEVLELESGGLPLGLLPGALFEADSADLVSGDLLCIYSDGITECASPEGEEYGMERLSAILRDRFDRPLGEIVAAIEAETTEFARGRPQGDDQTVLLLRKT